MKKFLPSTIFFKAISLFVLLFISTFVFSQTTYDWLNTAPDGNFRQGLSGARWNPGGLFDQPPFGVLRFNNNHELTTNNNVPGTYNQFQIVFGASNGSVRTISGNPMRFFDFSTANPKIENFSGANHVLDFNIEGDGDAADPLEINLLGTAGLTFGGTINNQGSFININGTAAQTVTMNGIISGSGGFGVNAGNILFLNAINTYTGNTEVNRGELWINTTGDAIASGSSIFIGNGGAVADVSKIFLSRTAGGTNFTRNFTMNNGNATTRFIGSLNTSGVNEFSGVITNSSTNGMEIQVVSASGTLRCSGNIMGTSTIAKIGLGTVEFSGTAKTYSGATLVSAGVLRLAAANNIANTSRLRMNGGIFSTGATTGFAESMDVLELNANSTIALGTGAHNLTFAASNGVAWAGGATLTITGWNGSCNGRIFVGTTSSHLTSGQLAQINFTGYGTGATFGASGEIVPAIFNNVVLTATSGTTPLAGYATVGAAFTAINGGVLHTGTIVMNIFGNTTESAAATLDQVAGVTSVTIQPAGCNARTVTGSVAGNGIIVLNGADNTTINGIARTGLNTLTISNTSTSNTASTSTIRMLNDANTNTITNCTILGSGTGAAYTETLTTANVLIEGSANGSDSNNISNNDITKAGSNFPSQLIASYGQGSGVAFNDSSTISNNNLFDFFNVNGMAAINLGINNNAWTISGNRIYQPTAQTTLGEDNFLKGININTDLTVLANRGNNYSITGNTIGFNSSAGTGMLTNTDGNFTGIEVTVASTTASTIDNNAINNVNWKFVINTTPFGLTNTGILVNDGFVNVGTTSGNVIGATSTIATASNGLYFDNIMFDSRTYFYGIKLTSTNNCSIAKNAIACLLIGNSVSRTKVEIFGITLAGSGNFTVIQNNIGSNTADSIKFSAFTSLNSYFTFTGINILSTGSKIIGGSALNANIMQNITADGSEIALFMISSNNGLSTIDISFNTFKKFTATLSDSFANHQFYSIYVLDNATAATINNNNFGSITEKLATFLICSSFNRFNGIALEGDVATFNVNNNEFYDFDSAFTANMNQLRDFIKISNVASYSGTCNVLNNKFNNISINCAGVTALITIDRPLAATGKLKVDGNAIVTGLSINNSFSGGNLRCLNFANGAIAGSEIEITNNNFSNINIVGNMQLLVISTAATLNPVKYTINNNTLENCSTGNAINRPLNLIGFGNNSTINNNVIRNITSEGLITAISLTGFAGSPIQVDNNTISQIFKVTPVSGTVNPVVGISCLIASSSTINVSNNRIFNLNSNMVGSLSSMQVFGIQASGNLSTVNIIKNKIYQLNSNNLGVLLSGIVLSNSLNTVVSNNFIGNFSATNASNSTEIDMIRGISVIKSLANSTTKLYYNTIFFQGGSPGNNFWSSGIFHNYNATATTNNLDMRNNLIINKCTPSGTGSTVAFRRSASTDLNNYNTISNNNVFYAGTPSANNLLFLEGVTGYQTMAAFQARVSPRENASVSEDANFVDVTPSVSDFHLIVPTNCLINGKGAPIAGFTDDIDGDVRDAVYPDPGADEWLTPFTTWAAGAWSPSIPNATRTIRFDDDYNVAGTNITACNCIVNTGKNVTIASNDTMTLTSTLEVNGTGTMTFNNGASLVQIDGTTNRNVGNIRYKRLTRALPNNYDFVYWGSPVGNQNIGSIWMASNNNDTFYTWNNPIENWSPFYGNQPMVAGTGYIARARNGQSGTNIEGVTNTYATATPWEALFKGVPNNGNYTTRIFKNGVTINNNSNLLGNPYPCALDIVDFFNDPTNSANLTSNAYFWGANTIITGNVYNVIDYAVFNATTNVSLTTSSGGLIADRYVDAGQGFFVEAAASVTPTGADVVFKNSHKEAGFNNAFFRNSVTNTTNEFPERHSIWLNMTNSQGLFKQQIVQYAQGATHNFDERFDAKSFDGNSYIDFYSINPNHDLVIQSRAMPFVNTDFVPLGFKTTVPGMYTIAIDHKDGLFNNQNVFLQDNLTNITHNLSMSAYNFTTTIGTFNNRFVLKYTNAVLGINAPLAKNNTVIVAKSNENIIVKSSNETINKITVYDVLGRILFEKKDVNSGVYEIQNASNSQQTLIVKVVLGSGNVVNRKV